jgi:hypothetical protein
MSSTLSYYIVGILIFVFLFFAVIYTKKSIHEGFDMYQQLPFQYMYTGSQPLSYYRLDRYRLPYRYPDMFFTNYPVPYFRYYD